MDGIDIRALTMETLLQTPIGAGLEKAFGYYETLQETVIRLMSSDDPESYTRLKVGTILTWAVLNKMAGGKHPNDFTKDDWEDVAKAVSKYAIMMDNRDYTVFVFQVYAKCIDETATLLESSGQGERAEAIRALAEELRTKTSQLSDGLITEPDYVEECLWICLEAVMKILCTYLAIVDKAGITDFAEASLLFALQYSRLRMYKREQALLDRYLRSQQRLDEELEKKYAAFLADLTADAEQFDALVQDAFSSDFRTALRGSAELARAAGVKEEEILETVEDVDDFFM